MEYGGDIKSPHLALSPPSHLYCLTQCWDLQRRGPERRPLPGSSGMRRNVCVRREVFGAQGGWRPSSFSGEGLPFSSQG